MLRKQGSTRQLSVTKVIPKNWKLIRMEVVEQNATQVILKITKLLEYEQNAQTTKPDKGRKQNA